MLSRKLECCNVVPIESAFADSCFFNVSVEIVIGEISATHPFSVLCLCRVHEIIGLGVGAGSYILSLFAIKYRERAIGLILVSPICRKPTWSEWIYNKVRFVIPVS